MLAQSTQEPFLDTFAAMLQDELDRRRSRLTERRFKHSRLDERPTLADFDWRFNPKLPRQACFELHTLKLIGEGGNALIIGKPGTGISPVAKAVGYQATLQGFDVRYVEADTEFARYALASTAEQVAWLRSFVEPDLVVVDDLFLARRISEASAELLQTVIHQRYKQRRSLIVTSNRVVQDWGKYSATPPWPPPFDRLMHRAAMLEFEGKSYRLKEAASRIALSAATDSSFGRPARGSLTGRRWGNLKWPSGLKHRDLAQLLPPNWRPATDAPLSAPVTAPELVVAQYRLKAPSPMAQGCGLRNAYED